MKPLNVPHPYSRSVLGVDNSELLKQKDAVLSSSLLNKKWTVKSKPFWQGRKTSLKTIGQILKGTFKPATSSPGRQLCRAYISLIKFSQRQLPRHKKTSNAGIALKTMAAFKLAGVCEINIKGDSRRIKSNKKSIDVRVISQLDRLSSHSPCRLAYEYIAANKSLPKGYINEVLKPDFVATMTEQGVEKDLAVLVVEDQFKKCGLSKEKYVGLENMMEVKNRLRHFVTLQQTQNTQKSDWVKPHATPGKPALERPDPKPGYECDQDDTWLIQHTVKNDKIVRIIGDTALSVIRWAKRNKSTGITLGVGLAAEALISGLTTFGIGAAITVASSVGTNVFFFTLSRVVMEVRSALCKRKLQHLDKDKSMDSFDSFLDSASYLTSKKGVTNILNAYTNLANATDHLKNSHSSAQNSVKQQIEFQKKKALMQLRHEQLIENFGIDGSKNSDNKGSYDQLMLKTVQELSRLESEFSEDFEELWEPFETMSGEERWEIFNKAANQSKVKGHWYKLSKNYHQWIQDNFKNGHTGLDAKLSEAFATLPAKKPEKFKNLKKNYRWNAENISSLTTETAKAASNIVVEVVKGTKDVIMDVPYYIKSKKIPSLKDFLPKSWGSFLILWAVYYFGGKLTGQLNKAGNSKRIEAIHKASKNQRFDADREVLSTNEWLALRRESKESLNTFVETLKELRKEHKKIKKLLTKTKISQRLSEDKRNMLHATALLRCKMLNHEIQTLLTGAIGHMHEETVRSTTQLQRSLQAIKVM